MASTRHHFDYDPAEEVQELSFDHHTPSDIADDPDNWPKGTCDHGRPVGSCITCLREECFG